MNVNQKTQKGWLSRWTRKQWSRHWFVLKNGSLTYYRGPAAELCSFLDGVLDLSLIKHMEVQQDHNSPFNHHLAHHQHSHQLNQINSHQLVHHHHIAANNQNANNGAASGNQFTFTLKMWNGECHQLGAASHAERQLWLEAINACINGDDDAATDSASSSDSSPTSNLSAKSTDIGRSPLSTRPQYNQAEQQLSLDHLALNLKTAAMSRRRSDQQADVLFDLSNKTTQQQQQLEQQERSNKKKEENVIVTSTVIRHRKQEEHQQDINKCTPTTIPAKSSSQAATSSSQDEENERRHQAFKRRLVCVQTNRANLQEPQLIARTKQTDHLYLSSPNMSTSLIDDTSSVDSNSSSESSEEEEKDDEEDDHDDDDDEQDEDERAPEKESKNNEIALRSHLSESSARVDMSGAESVGPVTPPIGEKQKKRVTFDLSQSSLHQLTSSSGSSADEDDSSGSDDESSLSSSLSASLIDENEPKRAGDDKSESGEPNQDGATIEAESSDNSPMDLNIVGDVGANLEETKTKVDLLEAKLSSSYANYDQLELSYKRLQSELAKCDELHKGELFRLQQRVDELTRELTANELRLSEAREKLLQYEKCAFQSPTSESNTKSLASTVSTTTTTQGRALNNWLRATSQQVGAINNSANQHHFHHHQPPLLLTMHHVKHTMAVNQQTLSLKLLNHSKQIQRKLNELELKVDKIQSIGLDSKQVAS